MFGICVYNLTIFTISLLAGPTAVQVELEDLMDRPGVLTDEINWDKTLSSGEKQRFAIARLMYHRPAFAILDECTSVRQN